VNLAQVNVWLDIGFATLYVIVMLGLGLHLFMNVISGRLRHRFDEGRWPEHLGPDPSVLRRFIHFQHVFSMFALAGSGMYIRFPYFYGGRTFMRYVHYFFMTVVILNLLWRFWLLFLSKQRDYKDFQIQKQDISAMPGVLLYYTFFKSSKAHDANYNVMQKGTYMLFAVLLAVQALSGLALLQSAWPPMSALMPGSTPGLFNPQQVLLGWISGLFGGLAATGALVRAVHYAVNWMFIILATIHAYLSITEDFPAFENFFGLDFGLVQRRRAADAIGAPVAMLAEHGADN
jgi:Ni/Fe-hydrogenase 1 B-type cytochrome subunit